ncbi:uncharacterized protein LOC105794314 [Gossypium raimondii]|uniref:uncharacterized protein LOC105794314 n=1 Tax=Gossypium raimondii TaxID=29730 RepID=UPI00227BF518|nr:uncharacterized protein LOC105794314 [Gossypium raimondii]
MVLFNDYLFYYAGCCIRHRYDYGAIILLDEKNRAHISKWLRLSIRMYGSFEKSLDELRSFFREVKIKDGFAEGKDLVVSVMSALGEEQICALKDIGPK